MQRPRLLLVPQLTELDWRIKPQLETWAEVASFDAPGVGAEPPAAEFSRQAIVERGLRELDDRGWEDCVVVADEFGVPTAVALADARPQAVAGLALGHACLSHGGSGERAAVNAELRDALLQLARVDYRSFARHLTQVTKGAYDDELADGFLARVPQELSIHLYRWLMAGEDVPIRETLEALDVPLLLVEHKGCMLFTREGYCEAIAAFPHAWTTSTPVKPSSSSEFADALREFCAAIEGSSTAPSRSVGDVTADPGGRRGGASGPDA